MFRKPRNAVIPDTGRPPSPQFSNSQNMTTKAAPFTPTPSCKSTPKTFQTKPKSAVKNGSILSFFKKSESNGSPNATPLFFDDSGFSTSAAKENEQPGSDIQGRFNENVEPVKKRRLSIELDEDLYSPGEALPQPEETRTEDLSSALVPEERDVVSSRNSEAIAHERIDEPPVRNVGPFLDDSDSDEDAPFPPKDDEPSKNYDGPGAADATMDESVGQEDTLKMVKDPPALTRKATSVPEMDGFAEFEGMEDFDDQYIEGDEFMERRWQMEQRRLELQEQGFDGDLDDDDFNEFAAEADQVEDDGDAPPGISEQSAFPACPVCNISFEGISDQDAEVHVNHCLDGNPTPLPTANAALKDELPTDREAQLPRPTFRQPQRPAKPGQENPFTLGKQNGTSSAFSKLMSGHAEDAAWASAAAAEHAARGKPSYQRTCPFYKILPGFSICVDAFRYGAVEGCKAYFLSHFHSDHYVGLTGSWCHGPIYCSRPTANLVKQQLRVDPKWVVELEFEKKVEVPETNGVHVTMIPANHCPGSSLFFYEKVIGSGKNPKVQRVLHCGDFRACPSHVEHPLLKPDVVDSLTGKTKQQKIDVCYLDTTYLNPRYAFPSQEDVIDACAEKCTALNNSKPSTKEERDQTTKEVGGGTIANFVQRDSSLPAVVDEAGTHGAQDTTAHDTAFKPRVGRLLVVVGTYSIGKERICLGIARALDSKIFAPPGKQRICAALEDPELAARLTRDPRAAQVHMAPLFEIRAETLAEYLAMYRDTFARAVAFRPSGWNYRPPGGRGTDAPSVAQVLHSGSWRSAYGVRDLVPQRGSNARATTFGVPYSEHSSFRELTMFCCALRIEKVIPTVNVGSAKSRERMKQWVDRWNTFKKKEGLFKVLGEGETAESKDKGGRGSWYAGKGTWELRTTL